MLEAIREMLNYPGTKIRSSNWYRDSYVYLNKEGIIVDEVNDRMHLHDIFDNRVEMDWSIVESVKKLTIGDFQIGDRVSREYNEGRMEYGTVMEFRHVTNHFNSIRSEMKVRWDNGDIVYHYKTTIELPWPKFAIVDNKKETKTRKTGSRDL